MDKSRVINGEAEEVNLKYYPRLRELRTAVGMNQIEMGEMLHMLQNQYSRYERGQRELPMHLFIELAKFYNVSLDYIVGLTDTKERH
ncbi:MAG: helix-turn-helix transcriptional regulator [Ruminococcaceae bacterium]|nr:helix-turn-helix transcriptional regulator [Oscillospiraceae bacterium]